MASVSSFARLQCSPCWYVGPPCDVVLIVPPLRFSISHRFFPTAEYYRGDKSDENVSWTFNINVPTDPTIEPMYFRLAAAGLVEPPRQISLLADPNLTLGTFGTNMKCTQIARTVWDCAGMTTLTQADSLRLGASAGVGPQFASYGLALTYWNEQRQAATVQTSQVEVAEDSVRFNDAFQWIPSSTSTYVSGNLQAQIKTKDLKGVASILPIKSVNDLARIRTRFLFHSTGVFSASSSLTVLLESGKITLQLQACDFMQPLPGIWYCDMSYDFPPTAVSSNAAVSPEKAALEAAKNLFAAANPALVGNSVLSLTVTKGDGVVVQERLRAWLP
ncbi:unnamed protein product [Closterium sp. NIES-54]